MVSFLFFVYLVTILYCSDIVWSKDLFAYFFCFLPILDLEFSFFFAFSQSLIGNFLFFFVFSHSFDWKLFIFFLFSSEGKVYGELGSISYLLLFVSVLFVFLFLFLFLLLMEGWISSVVFSWGLSITLFEVLLLILNSD